MKKLLLFFLIVFVINTNAQTDKNQVRKIHRNEFIGQRIKFLKDLDNKHGYMFFGKSERAFPNLKYSQFKERTATFVAKDDDLFTLKMDDNGEFIYFKHYSFSDIPNNIGFFSLLDSARAKYLNKTFYNKNLQECKIVSIEFAEDTSRYSQLYGPYNIFYTIGKDTLTQNIHFTETYGPEQGYVYKHDRERVFENIFKNKKPPATQESYKDTIVLIKLSSGVGVEKNITFSISAKDFFLIGNSTEFQGESKRSILFSIETTIQFSLVDLKYNILKNGTSLEFIDAPGKIFYNDPDGYTFSYYIKAQNGYGNFITSEVQGVKLGNNPVKISIYH